jgi:hypothetical protein
MAEQFISEPLSAVAGSRDVAAMSRGEPGLPAAFIWRDQRLEILHILETWKTNTPGEKQVYLRRHWYRLRLTDGSTATVYCLRQAKRGSPRWWIYSRHG